MVTMRKLIYDNIKKATVAVAALNKKEAKEPFTIFGSGFCIDSIGIVITCRHVVEAMMSKSIEKQIAESPAKGPPDQIRPLVPVTVITPHAIFYDTTSSKYDIIAIPARVRNVIAKIDYDLAALYLQPHTSMSKGYPYIECEDFEDIGEGDDIGVCGFPLGNYLYEQLGTVTSSFTRGILSSIIPGPNVSLEYLKGFQLNVTATHGNSGGPVFALNSGKVFGVLTYGVTHPSGDLLQGLVKAEPVYPVYNDEFIERLKKAPEIFSTLSK